MSIQVTPEQQEALKKHLNWGIRKALFIAIIDDLLELFEQYNSQIVTTAIISKDIRLLDIIKPPTITPPKKKDATPN